MNEMLLYIRGLRKDYDIPLHGKRKNVGAEFMTLVSGR